MKTRFTLKTLLIITLVVAAYFAGRNAREGEIDELETKVETLQAELAPKPYREYKRKWMQWEPDEAATN